ncbi:MAG TPA: SDR family NAD(P)-dependent oxidoreductase, partial [Vicinamibacteria bacterium]
MRVLEEKGYEVFVELGPHPVLLGMGRGCVKDGYGSWMPSLRKGKDDWAQVLESVGSLYVGGVPVDWAGFDRDYDRRRVTLPTYPFQRQRYWVDGHTDRRAALRAAAPGYRQWLCDLEWQPAPHEASATSVPEGAWLLCGAESGSALALADALRGHGREVLLATPGPGFARTPGGFTLDPTQPDQVEQLIAEATKASPLAGIVHLWGLESPKDVDPLEVQRHVSGSALHLAQALARRGEPARLWIVTQGAQAVAGPLRNVDQASLWGLGRTLFVEQPDLHCVCVDLDPENPEVDTLKGVLLSPPGVENQIALRGRERYVARLVKSLSLGSPEPPPVEIRSDATYLVTGGLRGLGLEAAKWLVERGAKNLVLVGRRAPDAAATTAIQALEALGTRVEAMPADVADLAALRAVFAHIDAALPPLRGIVHCAGVLSDALLADQSWPRFAEVMGPKIKGAANLDTLTRARALDFFVLFSSGSSLLGSPGQLNYSAANAWMDALAHRRRGDGLCATAINWGPWGEVGMAAGLDEATRRRQAARGLGVIPPPEGFLALDHLLARAATQAAVLPIDWPTVLGLLPEPPPFLAALAAEAPPRPLAGATPAVAVSRGSDLLRQLAEVAESERPGLLSSHVRREALKVLGLEEGHPLNPNQPLSELGLDSLMALELRNGLGAALGAPLPPTLLFDYPTVSALAGHMASRIPTMREVAAEPGAARRERAEADAAIAVIGMSCRFPGGADSPEELWRLFEGGKDATREIPADRWDIDAVYDPDPGVPGKMYTRRGGFIEDIDLFDPHFFGISPREALSMDPQQRLLLEMVWQALERAGVAPEGLLGTRTGVFVGISGSEYAMRIFKGLDASRIDPYFGSGSAASIASGRLSYVLGLQGPSLSVDTACSSSLVAAHLACQ